jgi:hypothetical protein
MVVNETKPKGPPSEEETKRQLIEAFKEESSAVLALAYNYAKGFELCGDDVTKKWENVSYNMASIKQAYSKGFQAGLDFFEQQREEAEKKKLEIWKNQQGIARKEGDGNG